MTTNLGVAKSQLTRLADDRRFQEIAGLVERYMAVYDEPREFVRGKTRIPLSVPTYGAAEVVEALDSLMSTWVTMGAKVKAFEEMFAEYIGSPHAVMVNSGSSANLLALSAAQLPKGAEVITPALTWATTVWPIAQVGAVPVLVDVDRASYNISPEAIEAAITPKTRAIMPVHVLGNPCDMAAITDIALRHRLCVIEDCCEALGAVYRGRKVGSFGDFSTFSFYFSHHISTIEGGMILTNNIASADMCRSQRSHGWMRDLSSKAEVIAKYPSIDPRFLFPQTGYNLRPTEIQGAFGIHQLPRLEGLVEYRRSVASYLTDALTPYQDWLQLPSEAPNTRHSYMGYAITVRQEAPFTKEQVVRHLEGKGVETRPLLTGNIVHQPAMREINYRVGYGLRTAGTSRIIGSLENAQYIHDNGFYIGPHPGIGVWEREATVSYFEEFMRT